jgi:hypothetical protein
MLASVCQPDTQRHQINERFFLLLPSSIRKNKVKIICVQTSPNISLFGFYAFLLFIYWILNSPGIIETVPDSFLLTSQSKGLLFHLMEKERETWD